MRIHIGAAVIAFVLFGYATSAIADSRQASCFWGKEGESWSRAGILPDFSFAGYRSTGYAPIFPDDLAKYPDLVASGVTSVLNAKLDSLTSLPIHRDGATDDTPAFRNAIANLSQLLARPENADKIGFLNIPAGRYSLSGFLVINSSRLVLAGEDRDTTVLYFPRPRIEQLKEEDPVRYMQLTCPCKSMDDPASKLYDPTHVKSLYGSCQCATKDVNTCNDIPDSCGGNNDLSWGDAQIKFRSASALPTVTVGVLSEPYRRSATVLQLTLDHAPATFTQGQTIRVVNTAATTPSNPSTWRENFAVRGAILGTPAADWIVQINGDAVVSPTDPRSVTLPVAYTGTSARSAPQTYGVGVLAAPAKRGDQSIQIKVQDGMSIAAGDTLEIQAFGSQELALALHGMQWDPNFYVPEQLLDPRKPLIDFVTRVTEAPVPSATDPTVMIVAIERPLRTDLAVANIIKDGPGSSISHDLGVQNLTIQFPPDAPYNGHHAEKGYNALEFGGVRNCWVYNVHIENMDSGIFVGSMARFCSFGRVTVSSRRPPKLCDSHNPSDKGKCSKDSAGNYIPENAHHLLLAGGLAQDNVFYDFTINPGAAAHHDTTVTDRAQGNVFSHGSSPDAAFDHHGRGPNENLYTEIDIGAGSTDPHWGYRAFAAGGDDADHPAAGARETYWNIRSRQAIGFPKDQPRSSALDRVLPWGNEVILAGVNLLPGLKSIPPKFYVESLTPETIYPVNLFDEQLSRRLCAGPFSANLPARVKLNCVARAGLLSSSPPAPAGPDATGFKCGVNPEARVAPTATCKDLSVTLDANGSARISPAQLDGGSSGYIGGDLSFTASTTTFGCGEIGTQLVTLKVIDALNLTATCTARVTVSFAQHPVISGVTNSPGFLSPPPKSLIPVVQTVVAGNACDKSPACKVTAFSSSEPVSSQTQWQQTGDLAFSLLADSLPTGSGRIYTMTTSCSDRFGNVSAPARSTVSVRAPPTAVCKDLAVSLDLNGQATISAYQLDGGSHYPSGGPPLFSADKTSFGCGDVGAAKKVTLTVYDARGMSASCVANVTVKFSHAPAISSVTNSPASLGPTHTLVPVTQSVTAKNACDPGPVCKVTGIVSSEADPLHTLSKSTGDLTFLLAASVLPGSAGRTYTTTTKCTDRFGNVSSPKATTVKVSGPPVAVCRNRTLELDPLRGVASLTAQQLDGGSRDPKGGPVTLELHWQHYSCTNLGVQKVGLIVTDQQGYNAKCTAAVTVVDRAAPRIVGVKNTPSSLGLPVSRMIPVVQSVATEDACDKTPVCKVISFSSDETQASPQWRQTGNLAFTLGASSSQAGDGRTYTMTTTCTDASGNVSAPATSTVNVLSRDACVTGYFWRKAVPKDRVCVTSATVKHVVVENELASGRRVSLTSDVCKTGYVWRNAVTGDHVCVTPASREQTALDNRNGPSHRMDFKK